MSIDQSPSKGTPAAETSAPQLMDRANGVHGVYCIGRIRNGTIEYWTGEKWAAFCNDLYFDLRSPEKAAARPLDAVRWICSECSTVNSNNDLHCCIKTCKGCRPFGWASSENGRVMATIYSHKKPNDRMLYWAHCRRDEIKNHIEQLQLEDGLMADIIAKFKPFVCPACMGQGHVMRPIPGCECDGPRMHKCDRCNGTGEPPSSVSEISNDG